MRLTPRQAVVLVEALLAVAVLGAVAWAVTAVDARLSAAGLAGWAIALVWVTPVAALARVAHRFELPAEAERWHGAALRRVEALVDEDEDDDAVVDEDEEERT